MATAPEHVPTPTFWRTFRMLLAGAATARPSVRAGALDAEWNAAAPRESQARVLVRMATPRDLDDVVAIYNEGIRQRTASFQVDERVVSEIVDWLGPAFPLLVAASAHEPSRVVGWIRVAPHSPRACYRGIGDYSVYVARHARGRRVGDALMRELLRACARAGLWKVLGRIFPENGPSRALAARHGFREVGVYEKHAMLDGRWRDVVVVERLLRENLA